MVGARSVSTSSPGSPQDVISLADRRLAELPSPCLKLEALRTILAEVHATIATPSLPKVRLEPIDSPAQLTPLLLLVDDQEWTSRSLESILRPKGYLVLKASTGQQALDLVEKVSPDAIIVEVDLPDMEGTRLVRRLRDSATVHFATPILMVTDSSVGRATRLDALGAGAWDILAHPIDPNEIILRLDTFVRAKQEADRVRDEGLTDPSTGVYNVRGVLRRAREIGADASRFQRPLTCVAFGLAGPVDGQSRIRHEVEASEGMIESVASALRHATRDSDTIGRLGPGEFVVIAPGTDGQGALRLADRVLAALDGEWESAGSQYQMTQMRAGLCSIGPGSTSPEDLLLRATMALRRAQTDNGSFRIRSYEA